MLFALLLIIVVSLLIDAEFFGVSRRWLGHWKIAREITELERDVALNPHNVSALNDLGRLRVLRGAPERAVEPLERAIERMHDSDEANFYLGLAYLRTGKEREGEERIKQAIELNPNFRYGEPFLRLGTHYLERGRLEEALSMLSKFEAIHTSSTEGLYLLGEAYRRLGRPEQAGEHYRKSVEAFHHSPHYKKRDERRWYWASRMALWREG
ncbi:MAG: tetratricopeptide repeat protein [Nitrospirota bacterium]